MFPLFANSVIDIVANLLPVSCYPWQFATHVTLANLPPVSTTPAVPVAPPPPSLPSAICLSFSVFPCVAGRAYWGERWEERVGEEPNHMTARKPGLLQYNALTTLCYSYTPVFNVPLCREGEPMNALASRSWHVIILVKKNSGRSSKWHCM